MTVKSPDVVGGLRVRKARAGWEVIHEDSGLALFSGLLRLRAYAEQARDELLATGADFTQDKRVLSGQRDAGWRRVSALWTRRAGQARADYETGEQYSATVHYGNPPQSLEAAANYRRALAWARELAETTSDDNEARCVRAMVRAAVTEGRLADEDMTPVMRLVSEALHGRIRPWEGSRAA